MIDEETNDRMMPKQQEKIEANALKESNDGLKGKCSRNQKTLTGREPRVQRRAQLVAMASP